MTAAADTTVPSSGDKPANLLLFERLYTLLCSWIVARARALADGDRDLQDDLVQTGLQTLWELCEPCLPTLSLNTARAQAYGTMVEYRRAERRATIIGTP